MKIYKVATSDSMAVVPSTSLRHRKTSLRYRSSTRWLSVAETTIEKENAKILDTIKELL